MRIATRSEMRLHQGDAQLEYARLALAEGAREKARGHVGKARRLVDETGYGPRRPAVEALEGRGSLKARARQPMPYLRVGSGIAKRDPTAACPTACPLWRGDGLPR